MFHRAGGWLPRVILSAAVLLPGCQADSGGAVAATPVAPDPAPVPPPAPAPPPPPALPGDVLPAPLRTIRVGNFAELMAAAGGALPGDQIVASDGDYDTTDWLTSRSLTYATISRSGTSTDPIVITAEHVGGVQITGLGGLRLSGVSYLWLRGFSFKHNQDTNDWGIQLNGCRHVRVTRNRFELVTTTNEISDWIQVVGSGSQYNRIDHNSFLDKPSLGVFVLILGSGGLISQYDRIDSNHFYRQTNSAGNGGEALRIGNSSLCKRSAFATVESNLFEECRGDTEIITNKSSDNTYRGNTFRNNSGSLTLRHGSRATVDGNFWTGGNNGLRIYGFDNRIVNNYFAANTGSGIRSAIALGTGTVTVEPDGSHAEYLQSQRTIIAFNTLVGNSTGIVIGYGGNPLPPLDCVVANNIVKSDTGTLVSVIAESGTTWNGNILHGSAANGGIPPTGFVRADPRLALQSDGLYRLASTSPAIDASLGFFAFVTHDFDGQARVVADVGADEYSTGASTRKVLAATDVGPLAP